MISSVAFVFIALAAMVECSYNSTMSNLKVLVSSNDYPESGLKILREHFTVLQTNHLNFGEEGKKENYEELLNLIPGCSALVWLSHHPITNELLDKAGPSLKMVATVSAGYNHCNVSELKARGIKLSNTPDVLSAAVAELALSLMLGAARRFTENLRQVERWSLQSTTVSAGYNHCNVPELKARGIKLSNTPDVLSAAVAELTLSLMLGAARRFTENLRQVESGEWEIGFQKVLGQEIRGSTVGIIGFGGIGQAVAKRLSGFEVSRILYTGHREKPEAKDLGAEFVSLDALLSQSDFVVLSVPLTNETQHMINSTTLGKMKKNAILINVGRGDLVDQDALYDALKNNQIYAAGLDVTTPEPLPKDHKLLTLSNIFILPHIGSATVRTRSDMGALAANNVLQALSGQPLLTPVLP